MIVDSANISLRRIRQALGDQRGQSLVEFALVLPLLVTLIMGILWFGRALNYSSDETHLANEAARYAAVNSNPGASTGLTLNQWILNQIDTSELKNGGTSDVANPAQLEICFPNTTANLGDPVMVKVSSTFHFAVFPGLDSNVNLGSLNMARSATMRIEVPPTPPNAAYQATQNPPC